MVAASRVQVICYFRPPRPRQYLFKLKTQDIGARWFPVRYPFLGDHLVNGSRLETQHLRKLLHGQEPRTFLAITFHFRLRIHCFTSVLTAPRPFDSYFLACARHVARCGLSSWPRSIGARGLAQDSREWPNSTVCLL